jgi:hypothetical protein
LKLSTERARKEWNANAHIESICSGNGAGKKGVATMAEYRKPEIAVLGDASRVIEGMKPHVGDNQDLTQPGPIGDEMND